MVQNGGNWLATCTVAHTHVTKTHCRTGDCSRLNSRAVKKLQHPSVVYTCCIAGFTRRPSLLAGAIKNPSGQLTERELVKKTFYLCALLCTVPLVGLLQSLAGCRSRVRAVTEQTKRLPRCCLSDRLPRWL